MRQIMYPRQIIAVTTAKTHVRSYLWIWRVLFACSFFLLLLAPFLRLSPAHALRGIVLKGHPYFSTGFESGDPQPTWRSTGDSGVYPAGGVYNVGSICCKLKGPEMTVRREWAHQGSAALLYSGYDRSPNDSYAYMKVFDTTNRQLIIDQDTELDYWIYPQSAASNIARARGLVRGSNSACVAVDLLFSNGSNLRDASMRDQSGNYIHPSWQCNHLKLDTWNYVEVDLGFLQGRQITRIDVGYDQAAHIGGYRGYIDALAIHD
ncbi:MAG TPA: hypothetical protein VL485_20145 [Ktedonobacteraceae bacterium]|nr:hypothetical protein [Ktedonobacteraceae bacterium]